MTNISHDDVRHLAQLSNLSLQDDEIDTLAADLGNILGYVKQLGELETEGVEPTYQVTDLQNIGRSDIVGDVSITREQLLALTPATTDNQVKVPKVL